MLTDRALAALEATRARPTPQNATHAAVASVNALRDEPGPASCGVFSATLRWLAAETTGLDPNRRIRSAPAQMGMALREAHTLVDARFEANPDDSALVVARATAHLLCWLRMGRAPEEFSLAKSVLEALGRTSEVDVDALLSLAVLEVLEAGVGSDPAQSIRNARATLERVRRASPEHPELPLLSRRLEQRAQR